MWCTDLCQGATPAEADISYTVHTGDFAYPYDWLSTAIPATDGSATITLADDGGDNYRVQIGADAIHAVRTGISC